MDLGNAIKDIRKEKKLSQGAFASLCGITQTYLSQIEHNQKEPNLSTLKLIANALNIPLPILFFLSITEDDVPIEKRIAFNTIGFDFKSLVHEFFTI